MGFSEQVNPEAGAARWRADYLAIDDLESARVSGIFAVPLIEVSVDRRCRDSQCRIDALDLITEFLQAQSNPAGVGRVDLVPVARALDSDHVN
jgi:hypothetical protein